MSTDQSHLGPQEYEARSKIGRYIVYWAITAVTILGLAAIWSGSSSEKNYAHAKDVLSMLLPVIGAWVGTVLAFYFSRENFAAATESNVALLQLTLEQRLQGIQAKSVMLSMDDVDAIRTDAAESKIRLKEDILLAGPVKNGRNRVPILKANGVVRYIIHRSMVDKFISEKLVSGKAGAAVLTLGDLLSTADYKAQITSFGAVKPEDSLSLVKDKMDANPKCQDIIVTSDGLVDRPALGWITNVIILEKSRA